MTRSSLRLTALAVLALSTGMLASCGDDESLAPPDGTACTVGTIAPGDSVASAVTGSSCNVYSDYTSEETVAESWTLNAKANTAYIVRLYHLADTAGFDNLDAELFLYGRNAAGDAEWETSYWNAFGTTNVNGGANRELPFVSSKDQVVSLRIEADSPSDTGRYAIQVEACPAPLLTEGTIATLAVTDSAEWCASRGFIPGQTSRAAFWIFPSDTLNAPDVTFTRTAGDALFRAWVTGPELDVPCYSDYCTWGEVGATAGPTTLSPTIYLNGTFAAIAVIPQDSLATMSVELVNNPVTAPRPPYAGPAMAGRNR